MTVQDNVIFVDFAALLRIDAGILAPPKNESREDRTSSSVQRLRAGASEWPVRCAATSFLLDTPASRIESVHGVVHAMHGHPPAAETGSFPRPQPRPLRSFVRLPNRLSTDT